ncbi:BolA-like protein [Bdellovibrio bacteriovorus W]|nr:BolA-like protein [Bdellovibrio bacteriovorus W]
MSSRLERLQDLLDNQLHPSVLQIENESDKHSVPPNSETHFKVLVVSEIFVGKSRIDRQRLVNDIIAGEYKTGLHALTQRALTPEEWAKEAGIPFESPDCLGGSKVDSKMTRK